MDTRLELAPTAAAPPPAEFAADLALAEAILRRDRKATAAFVQLYTSDLVRYLRSRLLPRTDLVDDLAQDVFLAAWRGLPNYRATSPLKGWLLGIARHKLVDHYRERLRALTDSLPEGSDYEDTGPSNDTLLDRRRADAWTGEILAELPEIYALVLRWRYWEQRGAREMAESAGRSEKSIERLLARARTLFREKWLARESGD